MFDYDYVSRKFLSDFSQYKNFSIAVYGMGNNAKAVLNSAKSFQVKCVIVQKPDRTSYCGYPVVSIEQAISMGVDMVLIAAEIDIELIIFRRIQEECRKNRIIIRGLHFGDIETALSHSHLWENDESTKIDTDFIKKQIDCHDAISFDIFDTLLVRKTLFPTDVFSIIGSRAKRIGIDLPSFDLQRIHAEWMLAEKNPTLDDIYLELQKELSLSDEQTSILKGLELQAEENVIYRREVIFQLFSYALESGKRVYLVSDMYLPEKFLKELLSKNGIQGYSKLFLSCACRSAKDQDLFSIYLRDTGEKSCLHIGDIRKVDGLCAVQNGIDAVIVPSTVHQLNDDKGLKSALSYTNSLNEKSILGLTAGRLFKNPFAVVPEIKTAKDFGFVVLGPAMTSFMIWLLSVLQKERVDRVLFAARDGFLFYKLYSLAQQIFPDLVFPPAQYFYTSRSACMKAYCRDDASLQEVRNQFSFDDRDISRIFTGTESCGTNLQDTIFPLADEAYSNYERYIRNQGIQEYDRLIFVDLISGGTCQYFLQKMFFPNLKGMYFCQSFGIIRKIGRIPDISSMLVEYPTDVLRFYSKYDQLVLFESIVTSPQPSLAGFSSEGAPVFLKEYIPDRWKFSAEAQNGIVGFFGDFASHLYVEGECMSPAFLRETLAIRNQVRVSNAVLEHLYLEDEFFNRSFTIKKTEEAGKL